MTAPQGTPAPSGGRTAPTLATGGVIGIFQVLLAISFGGLVFAGALTPHAGVGIGTVLFGAAVVLVVTAFGSRLVSATGSVQDVPAAVLVVVAAGVVTRLGPDHPDLVGTVMVTVAVTSALIGVALLLLGLLRWGQLARFVPFPVIGGFLGGTGWLLLVGGVDLLAPDGLPADALASWSDPTFLALVGAGGVIGVTLLVGVRRGLPGSFVPTVALGAVALFHLVVLVGPGRQAAEQAGWLLGPFPENGRLWPPDVGLLAGVDLGAVAAQVPAMLVVVALSVLAMLLYASGVELITQQDGDLDRELRVAGVANLAGAAGGGMPGFHAPSLTALVHRAGADARRTALVAAGVVIVSIVAGGALVEQVPRPVVGGLLVFLGLSFLVEWLWDARARMVVADHAVVVLIVVVIAAVGFLEGVVVGVVATVLLFVTTYSRADVVKHALDGEVYPSHVDRRPEASEVLRGRARSIAILELQGFLFFGTANRLLDHVRDLLQDEPADDRRFVVLDFRHVTGLDSSTILSFRKAAQLASRRDATVVLSGLRDRVAEQVERGGIPELDRVRVEEELDRAVQWCEDQLLAEAGVADGADVPPLRSRLIDHLGDPVLADRLQACLDRLELEPGERLIAQGTSARELYFLDAGTLTVSIVAPQGERRRLRTMMAGNVVGEVAFYLDAPRSADVVAETRCVVYHLPSDALDRIERNDPEVAAALHQFLAHQLAERLASTVRTLRALGT